MKSQHRILLCAAVMGCYLASAEAVEPLSGAMVGMLADACGQPVIHATVTAVRADGSSTRANVVRQ